MQDGGRDKIDIILVLLCSPLFPILANSITIHVAIQAKILQFSLIYHFPFPDSLYPVISKFMLSLSA